MSNDKFPKKKKIKVHFENPEGKMILKISGKNATENAFKIITVFDDACGEIRKQEKEE